MKKSIVTLLLLLAVSTIGFGQIEVLVINFSAHNHQNVYLDIHYGGIHLQTNKGSGYILLPFHNTSDGVTIDIKNYEGFAASYQANISIGLSELDPTESKGYTIGNGFITDFEMSWTRLPTTDLYEYTYPFCEGDRLSYNLTNSTSLDGVESSFKYNNLNTSTIGFDITPTVFIAKNGTNDWKEIGKYKNGVPYEVIKNYVANPFNTQEWKIKLCYGSFYTKEVLLPPYKPFEKFHGTMTLVDSSLSIKGITDRQEVTVKHSINNGAYHIVDWDNIPLKHGISEIIVSTKNNGCRDTYYANVFKIDHNYVYKKGKDIHYDFWSDNQLSRDNAIELHGYVTPRGLHPMPKLDNNPLEGEKSGEEDVWVLEATGASTQQKLEYYSYKLKGLNQHEKQTVFIHYGEESEFISQTINFTLESAPNIEAMSEDIIPPKCIGGNGTVKIKVSGGLGGKYVYTINDDSREKDFSNVINVIAGKNTIIIKDEKVSDNDIDDFRDSRAKTIEIEVDNPQKPKIEFAQPLPVCYNAATTVTVSLSHTFDDFKNYVWTIDNIALNNGSNVGSTADTPPLYKGTHKITCEIPSCWEGDNKIETNINIDQFNEIEFTATPIDKTCTDRNNGEIEISDVKNTQGNNTQEKNYTAYYSKTADIEKESSKALPIYDDQGKPQQFAEGLYKVYIIDRKGCVSAPKDVTISSQTPIMHLETTAASCADVSNGKATFSKIKNIRFEPSPESIKWTKIDDNDNENKLQNANGNLTYEELGFGKYQVFMSDGQGCYFQSSFEIKPNSYSFSSSTKNASCAAAPNGSAEISATISTTEGNKQGEFNPTCYSWTLQDNQSNKNITDHTSTTNTISGLLSGTYNVKINHDGKCTSSTEVVIGTNTYNFQGTQYHDLSCVDASNGDITAQINKSGNGDFNIKGYKWHVKPHGSFNNSSQDKNIFYLSGINEGEYTLEINHDNYCTESTTVNISVNDYEWSTNHLYLSCEEVKNGYISATINRKDDFNGVFKINKYSWTVNDKPYKSGENPANEKDGTYSFELTDLDSGLYHLSLTHDEKCTESTTVKIDVNQYSHFVNTTNAPCAEIPSATATAVTEILSGTEGSFKPIYTWTVKNSKPEPTGSVNTISNRFFGDYNVKIEWANGCSESIDFTIQHDTLKPSLLTTNAECSDKESVGGKAVLNISTPDKRTYSYSWDTQEDNNNIKENLPAGSHNVTVIDNHGCHLDVPFTILNANFSADVKTENALCRQDATGKVTFDIKGGRGMYTINWNGNSNLSQKNISTGIFTQENIPVGIYHVDIKDETNCVVSHKVTISSGNLKVSHKESDASCASIGNAQAEITVSGAKLPVTYKWSDNVETSEPLRSNLSKGNYVVTVVDQNDCSMPVDINIYSKKLSTATAIDSATCGLAPDGAADIKLFSATFPATFSWPDGKTTTDGKRSGLDKGNYDVLITDANGCEVHADIFIPHKGYLQNDVPSNINLCANGEITVDANEFDGYQWVFNGRNVDNNRFYTIKSPGTYIVKANGYDDCYAVDTIAVSMSSKSFSPYFRMSSVSYINDTLVVMEMSQTNPDKYSWKYDTLAFDLDNTKGSDRELRLIPKISGIYSITLSAENEDCVSDISKPVEIFATTRPDDDLSPLYVDNSIVKEFTISPNPTKGPITVEVNLSQIADVRLTIYDLNFGKIRKQVTLHNSDNYKLDINDVLYTGAYVVILQAGNETKQIKYIVGR